MQKQEIISEVQLKTGTALNSWQLLMAAHVRDGAELVQQVISPVTYSACHTLPWFCVLLCQHLQQSVTTRTWILSRGRARFNQSTINIVQ